MIISVKVIPKASRNKIEYVEDIKALKVWTTSAPVNGKANEKVIELLAKYLNVNKSFIQVISGLSSRNKIIEVEGIDLSRVELGNKE